MLKKLWSKILYQFVQFSSTKSMIVNQYDTIEANQVHSQAEPSNQSSQFWSLAH